MIPDSKIQALLAAARRVPSSDQVPYAFERRVMAALRDSGVRESTGWAVTGIWRAAIVSVALAIVSVGVDLSVEDPGGGLDVEEALELAILPADDGETEL